MVFMTSPRKIKLELMSNEIEAIIEELERVPYSLFRFLNYSKLVDKLKKAQNNGGKK